MKRVSVRLARRRLTQRERGRRADALREGVYGRVEMRNVHGTARRDGLELLSEPGRDPVELPDEQIREQNELGGLGRIRPLDLAVAKRVANGAEGASKELRHARLLPGVGLRVRRRPGLW